MLWWLLIGALPWVLCVVVIAIVVEQLDRRWR